MDEIKTLEELKNAYPEIVNELITATKTEAVNEERARLQDIEKIAMNIAPELVNKAKYEEPKNARDLAFEAMQMDNVKGTEYLAKVKADAEASNTAEVKTEPAEQEKTQITSEEVAEEIGEIANKMRR